MGKQMELNCLAEVTFMLWVFMAIITNNRKRLDVAESPSASWGAGTDSVNVRDLKSKDRTCACTHTSLQVPTCVGDCAWSLYSVAIPERPLLGNINFTL